MAYYKVSTQEILPQRSDWKLVYFAMIRSSKKSSLASAHLKNYTVQDLLLFRDVVIIGLLHTTRGRTFIENLTS